MDREEITMLAHWWGLLCLAGFLLVNVPWTHMQSSLNILLTVTCLWGPRVPWLYSQGSKMSETDFVTEVRSAGEQCKAEFSCVSVHVDITAETIVKQWYPQTVVLLPIIEGLDDILKMDANLEMRFTMNCPHLAPLGNAPCSFFSGLYYGHSTQGSPKISEYFWNKASFQLLGWTCMCRQRTK